MSVALKWIEPEELGAYLKKGWTEVELRFEASGKYLIASPDEPASEPAKVETTADRIAADIAAGTFRGAQPEPVAEEMPEAVHEAANYLRQEARYEVEGGLKRTVHGKQIRARVLNDAADALESFWRTHAAQPAKVRMTEELQRVLEAAETQAAYHTSFTGENPALECREIRAAIAAVRAQAAEAGKVRMPKVRELLDHLYTEIGFSNKIDVLTQAAFAALDAVEGKGEGRG